MKMMSIGKKIGAALLAALMTAACAPAAVFADTASDTARAESFSIRTYNETRTEDDQNIEVTVRFDRDIQVLEGAEADVSVKIAGSLWTRLRIRKTERATGRCRWRRIRRTAEI